MIDLNPKHLDHGRCRAEELEPDLHEFDADDRSRASVVKRPILDRCEGVQLSGDSSVG